jgi:hypothetical protein
MDFYFYCLVTFSVWNLSCVLRRCGSCVHRDNLSLSWRLLWLASLNTSIFWVHRRLVRWKSTDVVEEYFASIFRVEKALVPSCFTLVPCLAYSLTMKVESSCSSEKSVAFQRAAWYYKHIPAENTLHKHVCVNVVGRSLLAYRSNSLTLIR